MEYSMAIIARVNVDIRMIGLKKLLITIFLVVLGLASTIGVAERVKYNFNPNWKVKIGDFSAAETTGFDDSSWKTVSTPYAWNEDDAFRKSIQDLPVGIAWYRKRFVVPPEARDKKILLEF